MPFFYSFFAALIPMFFYLIFLWRLDKNERESFINVFRHFLWGAFGAVILGVIFSFFFTSTIQMFISHKNLLAFTGAVFIAPIVEETTKGIYLLRTSQKNYFDNITDGLVYGGAIGLGFGMTENLMYFIQYDETFIQWATLVFTRSVFSAVMHAIATATFGAFLAKAKFTNSGKKYVYPFVGLILAMSFHFIWNLTLSLEFTYLVGIIFMIFLIVSFLIIFNLSIKE
ncbi:MAG: PrsW family intramembrane metalloprotease, partial [Ignavibacteriae bacterium]|nr:PrsW family intramembrane metalloprotease [Ignavibacteriota bacterium]